jgi:hypothetical protein
MVFMKNAEIFEKGNAVVMILWGVFIVVEENVV